MSAASPLTVLFAEEDTLFRLMEMALLRESTPQGEQTLAYFFGAEFSVPQRMLVTMADRLGLPGEVRTIVAQCEAELDAALTQCDMLVLERTQLPAARIAACADKIKLIQQFGQDSRHIDLAAARARNVTVADLARLSNLSCADHVLALVLALARSLLPAHRNVIARRDRVQPGRFPEDPPRNKFNWGRIRDIRVLSEHSIGFIGMGEIARLAASRLCSMGMRVVYYKRTPLSGEEEQLLGGISYLPLDELLATSDFVSIHVPYEKATEKLVDAAFLSRMKQDAYLINTARGGICDEKALYEVLKSGHLAGAALDVYRYEPVPPDCPLLDLDNILWSPHIAGGRPEFMVRESEDVLTNIARVLRGQRPTGQLSPIN